MSCELTTHPSLTIKKTAYHGLISWTQYIPAFLPRFLYITGTDIS